MISNASSNVPRPPGMIRNASDSSYRRRFAGVHAVGDDHLGDRLHGRLPICVRNSGITPEHRAAGVQHGVGDDAHDADPAAAIDQADAGLAEASAERAPGVGIGRVDADAGAAEHGERVYSRHEYPSLSVLPVCPVAGKSASESSWRCQIVATVADQWPSMGRLL